MLPLVARHQSHITLAHRWLSLGQCLKYTSSVGWALRRIITPDLVSEFPLDGVFLTESGRVLVSHQKGDVDPMLVYCWASVSDAGPTLNQHSVSVSCLPECLCVVFIVKDSGIGCLSSFSVTVAPQPPQSLLEWGIQSQPMRDIQPLLVQCWDSVVSAGPTLNQQRFNVSCLLG